MFKKMKTSKLWWIGLGFRAEYSFGEFKIAKGHRKIYVAAKDIKGVRVERRMFRGWTLVVETNNKPVYFRATEKGARKMTQWINSMSSTVSSL